MVNIHNDDGGNQTNPETGNDTATNKKPNCSRGNLKGNTAGKDKTGDDDGQPTADPIRKITAEEGTKECTGRENGSNQTLFPCICSSISTPGGIGGLRSNN